MTHAVVDHTKLVKPSGAKPRKSKYDYLITVQRYTLAIRGMYVITTLTIAVAFVLLLPKTIPQYASTEVKVISLAISALIAAVLFLVVSQPLHMLFAGRQDRVQSALYRWHKSVPQGLVTSVRQGERADYVTLYGYTRAGVLTHETHEMDFDVDMPPTEGEYVDIRSYRGTCTSCGSSSALPVIATAVAASAVAVVVST